VLVQVVGAALVRNGRLLACRRTGPAHLAGLWELPGGKVEPGESDEQALLRELQEELGITVVVGPRVGPELDLGGTAVMRVHLCALPPDAGEPVAHEHDALRWLGPDELEDVPWIPADAPVLGLLAAQLRGMSRPAASGGADSRGPG